MKKFNLVKEQGYFQSLRDTKSVKTTKDENWVEAVEIEWYASTKDKDRVWDVVVPQAFKSALEWYMMNPIVLLQHKADKPIWVVEEANIDDNWLYIKAKITENTDWVMNQIKNWVLRAFSIWYRVKDYDTDAKELADWSYDFTNIIKDLELFEISVVSIPANPFALSKSIESLLEVKDIDDVDVSLDTSAEVPAEENSDDNDDEWKNEVEENNEEETNSDDDTIDNQEKEWNDEIENDHVDEEQKDMQWEIVEWEEVVEDEAVEQTEIEETEVEDDSENSTETVENDEVVDETSNNEVVETKSIEVSSQKAFDEINKKIDSMQKWFENIIAQKDEQIKSLQNKVDTMSKLFAESVSTVEQLSTDIKNIPVASWLSYKRPLKKGWYTDIVETIKSLS